VKISISHDGENYKDILTHQFNDVEIIGGRFDETGPHPQVIPYSFMAPALEELKAASLYVRIGMTVGSLTEENWIVKMGPAIAHTSADYILTGGKVKTIDD
jgi:hypothetical protein